VTAQKKDISDPQVIHDFACTVGDQTHLDSLYLLTVADVRGTNPKLWNAWKASLFSDFYERTKRALRRGLEAPIDQEQLVAETRAAALERLAGSRLAAAEIEAVWAQFNAQYFLRHSAEEIAWHTQLLARRAPGDASPLVAVHDTLERGGNAVLTLMPQASRNFALTTGALDQLGLNIVDARITPLEGGLSLDIYLVLEEDGAPLADRFRARDVERHLARALGSEASALPVVTRRAPRQVRMFSTATQIGFAGDPGDRFTIVELIAGDRPGLLSEVGKVLLEQRVDVVTAKIATVGERAEDVFYVTDERGQPLLEDARTRLQAQLIEVLDRRVAARG
jgi:[protein-PII] uridylyltransferase